MSGPQNGGGRTDTAMRKRAHRKGRERGCHVYITAETLDQLGIDPRSEAPWYRVWAGPRRKHPSVIVQFYGEA